MNVSPFAGHQQVVLREKAMETVRQFQGHKECRLIEMDVKEATATYQCVDCGMVFLVNGPTEYDRPHKGPARDMRNRFHSWRNP